MDISAEPALHFTSGLTANEKRKSLGLNQTEFWSRLGFTQSGGSRLESNRRLAKPVQILLELAYGSPEDASAWSEWLRKALLR